MMKIILLRRERNGKSNRGLEGRRKEIKGEERSEERKEDRQIG